MPFKIIAVGFDCDEGKVERFANITLNQEGLSHLPNILDPTKIFGTLDVNGIYEILEIIDLMIRNEKMSKGMGNLICNIIENLLGARSSKGESPLHIATSVGDIFLVRSLLANGGRPNLLDSYGNVPLHLVVSGPFSKDKLLLAKMLISEGASIDVRNNSGETPLLMAANLYASEDPKDRFLEFLLKNGANVDLQDNYGFTPLMKATERLRVRAVKLLLDAGANKELVNSSGETAFSIISKIEKLEDVAGIGPQIFEIKKLLYLCDITDNVTCA